MITSAYWWRGRPNWGDRLTPLLLDHFAGLFPVWAPVAESQVVSLGSVLEHIPPGWEGTVLGSGRLYEGSRLHLQRAKVLAVRGPLSARGILGSYALGDPGLLADEMVTVQTKKYALGLVPHWSDTTLVNNPMFKQFNPVVIDPQDDPLTVVRTIGECKKIVSSSLHGVILADAFGIPRRIEYCSQFDKEGGLFKFQDYSASIRTPLEVGKLTVANRFYVEDRKHELFDLFQGLGATLSQEAA
jgi:hypothetical protein